MPTRRSKLPLKLLAGAAALATLGYLFVQSLETTRADPYTVAPAHIETWTLELAPSAGMNAPLLSLRTRTDLVSNVFRQVFQRTMESMTTPPAASIPVVLRGEFERALGGRMTAEDLLASARDAGLESASHEPRCLAHRRTSEGRSVQQVYFIRFDSPSIAAFRERLAGEATGAFDAAAVAPVLFVASAGAPVERWLPIPAGEDDCVAPIRVES